jgi:transposase
VRAVLYEAAHVLLTRPLKGCAAPRSWVMRIAKLAAALARKLAVIMHRMLAGGAVHEPTSAAPCSAYEGMAVGSDKGIGC